jgi:hypothetical protein
MKAWGYVLYEGDMIVVVKMAKRCYLLVKMMNLIELFFFSYFGQVGTVFFSLL